MSRLKSIKSFFGIGLVIILIPIYLLMAYFSYVNEKEKINQYKKTAVETSINGTLVQINAAEVPYNFMANRYDQEMSEEILRFSKQISLDDTEPDKINLEKIKNSGPHYYDYYVINNDNVIVNSTFKPSLGIDFKKWPNYNNTLNEIRASGKIEISAITTEVNTGKLRKWAYLATKDKKYLLEIGLSDEELQKYAQPIDFAKLKRTISENSTLIKDVELFDQHHVNLVSGLEIKDKKLKTDLDKVYKSRKAMDFYDENGFLAKKYMFFRGLDHEGSLDGDNRLLVIKYDNTKNLKLLNDLRRNAILMFFLLVFILVVSTKFFANKYIVNPILNLKKSVEKLSTNVVIDNFEEYKIYDKIGPKEINSLAKSFNTMADKIGNTLVSKDYLRNIINSVTDIIIITDKNSVIIDVNTYAKKVLNKNTEEIIGKNVADFFTPKEKFEQSNLIFKDKSKKGQVDELEINLIAGKEERPVIVNISAFYDKNGNIMGFINSARDLTKLQNLVEIMQEKADKLLKEAEHDQLTDCLNRRGISKRSKEAFALAKNSGLGFSIIMLDIDDFKKVNDTFGHQEGDKILIKFADIMRKNCRKSDSVIRYGGEEFFLFLPNTSASMALVIGEKIKDIVAKSLSTKPGYQITVSGGVSEWKKKDQDFCDTVARADAALYKSKKSGKNQINYQE